MPIPRAYTRRVRILLISTYELGRQPVHVASPAAALSAAGHRVEVVDLAVEQLTWHLLGWCDAVAISVPMHTAMRLAVTTASQIKVERPQVPVAFYGLYAGVGAEESLGGVADRLIVGEYEAGLVSWAADLSRGLTHDIQRTTFLIPDRGGLPGLESYARLEWEGEARLVGAVEASHGCRHRCRHCPIPVVYDGRWRPVGHEVVLDDIDQLASAGAQHITFADPDFLNAPRYSMDVLRAAHDEHPDLTFDVTVKVSHILDHRDLLPVMADLGVLFIVSAFETVDEPSLKILDKGHSSRGMSQATSLVLDAGMWIRPTWLPFFPWTEPQHVAGIAEFIDDHRLWEATEPVQLALRLLVPEGSLLEKHPEARRHLMAYEPEELTWTWEFANSDTALIHKQLDELATEAAECGEEAMRTLSRMRRVLFSGRATANDSMPAGDRVPRLTESWFCCAEPRPSQLVSIGSKDLQSS